MRKAPGERGKLTLMNYETIAPSNNNNKTQQKKERLFYTHLYICFCSVVIS